MRILLYGLQSSGASLVTYFLGQGPHTLAIVDLWNAMLAPEIDGCGAEHVVVKAVVTCKYSLAEHKRSFRPDRTVLVLRHPVHNYVALSRKYYANESGALDDKFRRLESEFREPGQLDLVIHYEEFVGRPRATVRRFQAAGIPAARSFYEFRRDRETIRAFNDEHSGWCREHFESGWGFGNVHGEGVRRDAVFKAAPPDLEAHVRTLCPALCAHSDAYYRSHVSTLGSRLAGLWYDLVVPNSRRAVGRIRRVLTPATKP